MSRSRHPKRRPTRAYRRNADRRIVVTDDRRDPPDQLRLARALLQHVRELDAAQAEADARRQQADKSDDHEPGSATRSRTAREEGS
ncbi:hypothetical protein GOPIP_081_00400 [Gordonia polyisoprenivorans NBRC 16320 = JCM 10675]|uniref:Uncharacterized protein n=1 Tax=Gordonia polyisoprenivorans TaxID=84595 RepID=A0A846WJQ3_9ACTN|nr:MULTISPECIES: hypothetical protein [Gordonia]MDF3284956.1 hypothetical protein [Gordonia sp. N1V]NKY00591.1 hypothetical protein [Gordonia polyisoprenivorans]GAB25401.1 hypothetical protein GOPIP_081_00400 [Gordonia polyisoprenivorans NBRC 16320 = JCM 10675]